MLFSERKSLGASLAVALGVFLAGSVAANAEDGHTTKIAPVPESHAGHGHGHVHTDMGYDVQYGGGYSNSGHNHRLGNALFGRFEQKFHNLGQDRTSPGTGWCAPTKVPLTRANVSYWKYYPNYWSGYGPAPATPYYPMVYQPTDTAQMGYYYQHAPQWTPQPWRVPGAAHPAAWHNRYCGKCAQGQYPYGYGYGPVEAGIQGQIIDSQIISPDESEAGESIEEVEEIVDPQAIQMPAPLMAPQRPRISLVPDAPPEV